MFGYQYLLYEKNSCMYSSLFLVAKLMHCHETLHKHASGVPKSSLVDMVADMQQEQVFDLMHTKMAILRTAIDTACTILSIQDVVVLKND